MRPMTWVFAAAWFAGQAMAQPCPHLKSPRPFVDVSSYRAKGLVSEGTWIYPNEHAMSQAKPLMERTGSGVYLGVGTDRSLQLASLTRATHIVQMDFDLCVIQFNEINRWLIAVAKDLADYNDLRWDGTAADWEQRSREVDGGVHEFAVVNSTAAVSLRDAHDWWAQRTRGMLGRFQTLPPEDMDFSMGAQGPIPDGYRDANYLYYAGQFARVKSIVDAGRLQTVALNLQYVHSSAPDELTVAKLFEAIAAAGLEISVVDDSNVWWYVGSASGSLVRELAVRNPGAFFFLSDVPFGSGNYPQYGREGTFYYAMGQAAELRAALEAGKPYDALFRSLF